MDNPFDDAWATADEALEAEMGESLIIGGKPVTAPVSGAAASGKFSGMSVNSGVNFTVFLSAAQVVELAAEKGAPGLQGMRVTQGAFKGQVVAVRDLRGAGAQIDVGPLSSR